MLFREWCFGAGRPREIDTGKELIGIDHAERDKKEKNAPFENHQGRGTPSTYKKGCPLASFFGGFPPFYEFPNKRKNREYCVEIREADRDNQDGRDPLRAPGNK